MLVLPLLFVLVAITAATLTIVFLTWQKVQQPAPAAVASPARPVELPDAAPARPEPLPAPRREALAPARPAEPAFEADGPAAQARVAPPRPEAPAVPPPRIEPAANLFFWEDGESQTAAPPASPRPAAQSSTFAWL